MHLAGADQSSEPYGSSLEGFGPYEPSIASSASSSQISVFSDNLSVQSSIASSISDDFRLTHEDARERDRICAQAQLRYQAQNSAPTEEPSVIGKLIKEKFVQSNLSYAHVTSVAPPARNHARRCSMAKCQRPPSLIRQRDRKINFVDNLVDCAAQMVEVIWPLSVVLCSSDATTGRGVLPLRTYIEETLRRSRTSYSTLQVALYYLVLIKPHVPTDDFTMEQSTDCSAARALMCGRRMFLAALILASKYLQDRNYSAKAWSKMSGLRVNEINANERIFLEKINWKLHIPKPTFETWQEVVLRYTPQPPPSSAATSVCPDSAWKAIVPHLTPDLERLLAPSRKLTMELESPASCYSTSPTTPTPAQATLRIVNLEESKSQESTPTTASMLPRFLEPKPDIAPPTPLLARMGPLPTPQLTPSSVASSTPAVSACGSRRPSMCSAMAVAQKAAFSRCVLDACPVSTDCKPALSRRPSILSTSSGSSPESLMSDHSRSSRSSSVSSVSTTWSMAQPRTSLARLATCRNVRLPPSDLVKEVNEEGSESKPIVIIDDDIEMVSSPDTVDFSISDRALHAPHRHSKHAPHHTPNHHAAIAEKGRKRGRSRGHHCRSDLQEEVRLLLQESYDYDDEMDVDDRVTASPSPAADYASHHILASGKSSLSPGRIPAISSNGKKRTCLSSSNHSRAMV